MKKILAILILSTFLFSGVAQAQTVDVNRMTDEQIVSYISLLQQLVTALQKLLEIQIAQQNQITDIYRAMEQPPITPEDIAAENHDPLLKEYHVETCELRKGQSYTSGSWIFDVEAGEKERIEAEQNVKFLNCKVEVRYRYE